MAYGPLLCEADPYAETKAPALSAGAPALQLNSTPTLRTYIDATLWVGINIWLWRYSAVAAKQ